MYLREEALTDPLDAWLAAAFAPDRIEQTITAMADARPLDQPPTTTAARSIIAECDAKLARYRAALDAGADPAVVTSWIAQTQAERTRAEADLHAHEGNRPRRMSRADITNLVTALGDIATVLRDANPADKAEVYRQLGLPAWKRRGDRSRHRPGNVRPQQRHVHGYRSAGIPSR